MIAFPAGVKVWIAGGITDMRRGMNTLALQVQEGLGRDPHAGEIFCFRGRKGDLVKILWHDGVGMSLYLKRLEAGKFIWPVSRSGDSGADLGGAVGLSSGGHRLAQSTLDATPCKGWINCANAPVFIGVSRARVINIRHV